jgi:hypothetical protein
MTDDIKKFDKPSELAEYLDFERVDLLIGHCKKTKKDTVYRGKYAIWRERKPSGYHYDYYLDMSRSDLPKKTKGPVQLERALSKEYRENMEPPRIQVSGSNIGLDSLSEKGWDDTKSPVPAMALIAAAIALVVVVGYFM